MNTDGGAEASEQFRLVNRELAGSCAKGAFWDLKDARSRSDHRSVIVIIFFGRGSK